MFKRVISLDAHLKLEQAAMLALTLLAVTLAFELVRPLLRLPGLVLTNVEAVVLVVLGLWLLACVAARRRPRLPPVATAAAVAWLGLLILSALVAPDHRLDALKFVGRMTSGVLVAWAVYDVAREPARWHTLARGLAVGGLLVAVLGLAEAMNLPLVGGFLALFKEAPTVVGEALRVSSTLVYATVASMILEMSVPLLLAWVLTAESRRGRIFLGAGLVATLAAQLLTLTRGGLIALLAALGFMAAWAAWRHRRPLVLGSLATAGMLLVLGAAVLYWNPAAHYRLASETEEMWYQAAYDAPPRLTAVAGETVRIPVTLHNTGVRSWQTSGAHPFRLGYHLAQADGSGVDFDGGRFSLPQDVPPGARVEVQAMLAAPVVAGDYILEWDMVQEDVTWFSWEGAAPAQTRLAVTGASTAGARPTVPVESVRLSPDPTLPDGQGRLWLWRVAAGMFLKRPLLGVGPDNFRWLHAAYAGVERSDTRIHANNLYIEWLVGTGILGFAAFLWLMGQVVWTAWRALERDRATGNAIWRLALIACLVAWFVHGFFDSFYEFMPTYLASSMASGLALATAVHSRQEGQPCASDTT